MSAAETRPCANLDANAPEEHEDGLKTCVVCDATFCKPCREAIHGDAQRCPQCGEALDDRPELHL